MSGLANEALAEAYLQLLDVTRDNVERYEQNMNMACAFAWDMGRLVTEVKCYWCGKVLGESTRDADAIREHTADCEKRPMPTAAAKRIAELEARLAASHLAAQRMATEAAAEEREACAKVVDRFAIQESPAAPNVIDDIAEAIRARGGR